MRFFLLDPCVRDYSATVKIQFGIAAKKGLYIHVEGLCRKLGPKLMTASAP